MWPVLLPLLWLGPVPAVREVHPRKRYCWDVHSKAADCYRGWALGRAEAGLLPRSATIHIWQCIVAPRDHPPCTLQASTDDGFAGHHGDLSKVSKMIRRKQRVATTR